MASPRNLALPGIGQRSWAVWGPPGDERSVYRYELGREWSVHEGKPHLAVIGLNPSTATAELDDPTIRRCMRFARDNGFGGLLMLNLFAFRSTDPAGLTSPGVEPIGPDNDREILAAAREAGMVLAAWGCHGHLLGRGAAVRELLAAAGIPLHVLRLTKDGYPGHPLYLPAALKPVLWKEAR
jgi:hypothetical protein